MFTYVANWTEKYCLCYQTLDLLMLCDLSSKIFQVCDAKYMLALTTQIILCKLICPFAMALCNIAKYFACLLEIQKHLLIEENSEPKLITMNLPAMDVFSERRWFKMVALEMGVKSMQSYICIFMKVCPYLQTSINQICLCSSKHDVPHLFLCRGEGLSLSNEAEYELR